MGLSKASWSSKVTRLNWANYVWLLYLPYTVIQFLPARRLTDWVWLGLVGVFLGLYSLVAEVKRWRKVTMPLELGVAGVFSLFAANNYLIIFPGWQIFSILSRWPKPYFYGYAGGYYALLLGGLLRDGLVAPDLLTWQHGELMGLLFPLCSPVMAYAFSRSIVTRRQLAQTNRRLETIIQRNERERIARDLHDTLGQSFSMITIKAELAKKLLTRAPEEVPAELDDIAQTSRENLQLVRAIVNGLHQNSLSDVLLTQSHNLATAHVQLQTSGETAATKWPTPIQGRFSAVLREALTNVIRHAQANSVQVTFTTNSTTYRVVIQDDGRGGTLHRDGANGIAGMRARMIDAHGTFAITADRHGTQVALSLPKEKL